MRPRPWRFMPLLIAAGLAVFACQDPTPDGSAPLGLMEEEVDRGVRGLLDDWVVAFGARDLGAVRSILADDDRFVWLEDGEARYRDVDAIVAALESFPDDLTLTYRLDGVRVVAISRDAAWASMSTLTDIRQSGAVVSEFAGVVSMLVERIEGRWRIVAAHTSNLMRRSDPGEG